MVKERSQRRIENPPEIKPGSWEDRVLQEGIQLGLNSLSSVEGSRLPVINLRPGEGKEYQVLQNFYRINRGLDSFPDYEQAERWAREKGDYLLGLAREIKNRKQFYILDKLWKALETIKIPDISRQLLTLDSVALYLIVGGPNRLLVGTKDGIYWKHIQWPKGGGSELDAMLMPIASRYFAEMGYVGQKELATVPERVIRLSELPVIRLPKPARSIEELLEDAYYQQRYIVPVDGAEVRFNKAGDLQKMIIVQSGKVVFAKGVVSQGEVFLWLNLDHASWYSTTEGLYDPSRVEQKESIWVNILAEVYHDLVTAIELPVKKFRTFGGGETRKTVLEEGQPQIIYIPRVARVGKIERSLYQGPPRPVTPYKVGCHRRKANMTEEHRLRLMEFEKEYGIPVLAGLPGGYTVVRPYVVPAGSSEALRNSPTFIKRRIETQLRQELQR